MPLLVFFTNSQHMGTAHVWHPIKHYHLLQIHKTCPTRVLLVKNTNNGRKLRRTTRTPDCRCVLRERQGRDGNII